MKRLYKFIESKEKEERNMKTILFQGDSITDAGRSYEDDRILGYGYATLVAAELGTARPNEFVFKNRGISGDRSIDLLARVRSDFINLKPDYISILIGVNDVWHERWENGVDEETFEVYYDLLISKVQRELPNIKIMIMGPFVLKEEATAATWDFFRSEVEKREAVSKKIAEKYNLVFVPLMKVFDEAEKVAPANYWTWEGVHPTAMGHELIKREWLKAFEQMK